MWSVVLLGSREVQVKSDPRKADGTEQTLLREVTQERRLGLRDT